MDLAEPQELRILQARDQAENAALFRELQMILKSDDAVAGAHDVPLTELHDGIGCPSRPGIAQPDRPHGPEPQRVAPATGKFLDRKAGLKIANFFEIVPR